MGFLFMSGGDIWFLVFGDERITYAFVCGMACTFVSGFLISCIRFIFDFLRFKYLEKQDP